MDFFVERLSKSADPLERWIVHNGDPLDVLAKLFDVDHALRHATGLAQARNNAGESAQVHVRAVANADWRTLWHAPNDTPRYPSS